MLSTNLAGITTADAESARLINLTDLHKPGCRFEVTTPIEAYRVEQYGGEEQFTRLLLEELAPSDVLYDIGACVGLVTVHAALRCAKVVAFEPDPYYRSRLEKNLQLNSISNVQVVPWVVSDGSGEADLFTDGEGGNSLSLRQVGQRQAIKVPVNSIDCALAQGELPHPTVVKLDIEGAEGLALRGMSRLLVSKLPPRAIFIEVHPEFLGQFDDRAEDILDFIFSYGYELQTSTTRQAQRHYVFKLPGPQAADHLAVSRRRLVRYANKHTGERCVIIGNGPSLNKMDLSFLKDEITFGTNRIYLGFERWGFTPNYYVSVNPLVIEQSAEEILAIPCPKFLSQRGRDFIPDRDDVIFLESIDAPMFSRYPGRGLWEGFTVTYVAMQLAYYMGFSEVILIGVDHYFPQSVGNPNQEIVSTGADQNHFAANYFGPGVRWQLPDLLHSEIAYRLAHYAFSAVNRRILDATVDGKLSVFPKVDYRQVLVDPPARLPGLAQTVAPPAVQDNWPPLISVICLASGRPGQSEAMLNSVQRQTYPNLEIILVDRNPQAEGNALDPVSFARPVNRIVLEKDGSLASAMNDALELAQGDYIAYIDACSRYLPDHLATLVLFLERDKQFQAGYTLMQEQQSFERAKYGHAQEQQGIIGGAFDRAKCFVSNTISPFSLIHRRSITEKIGSFDETAGDFVFWDFILRLALQSDFAHIPVVTVLSEGQSQPVEPAAPAQEIYAAFKKFYQRYAASLPESVKAEQQAYLESFGFKEVAAASQIGENWSAEVIQLVHAANEEVACGDYQVACKLIEKALGCEPHDIWLVVTYTNLLLTLGRVEEAWGAFCRAVELDPLHPLVAELGKVFAGDGRGEEMRSAGFAVHSAQGEARGVGGNQSVGEADGGKGRVHKPRSYGADWDEYVRHSAAYARREPSNTGRSDLVYPGDEWGTPQSWQAYADKFLRPFLPDDGSGLAAEIGQGSGKYTLLVMDKVKQIVCFDVSQEFIHIARQRLEEYVHSGKLEFHLLDLSDWGEMGAALELDALSGKLDLLFSVDSMVHVELHTLLAYFITAARSLKLGGHLTMSVASCANDKGFARLLEETPWCYGGSRPSHQFYFLSKEIIDFIMDKLGFEIVLFEERRDINFVARKVRQVSISEAHGQLKLG